MFNLKKFTQDLIDDDDLLDVNDLKKPTSEDLKASCGTSAPGKKKKACKNWLGLNTKINTFNSLFTFL